MEIEFTEKGKSNYSARKARFISSNKKDTHYDFSENRYIVGMDSKTLIYNEKKGSLPWYARSGCFYFLSFFFIGFIQRIIFVKSSQRIEFPQKRLIIA